MSEELWNTLQAALAQEEQYPPQRVCVGCWYRTHTQPFPASASSSLCSTCKTQVSLQFLQQREQRRYGLQKDAGFQPEHFYQ